MELAIGAFATMFGAPAATATFGSAALGSTAAWAAGTTITTAAGTAPLVAGVGLGSTALSILQGGVSALSALSSIAGGISASREADLEATATGLQAREK